MPGQYIECTCKLATGIIIMTNNIMIFNQLLKMQHYMQTCCEHAQHVLILPTCLPDVTNKHDITKTYSWSLRRSPPDHLMARDPYDDHNPTNSWPVILTAITTWPILGPTQHDGLTAILSTKLVCKFIKYWPMVYPTFEQVRNRGLGYR